MARTGDGPSGLKLTMSNDIAGLCRHYGRAELRLDELSPDPIAQFKHWFDQAAAEGLLEPNAMSVATATRSVETTLRAVLLKGYSDEGFLFFTRTIEFWQGGPHRLYDWFVYSRDGAG